MNQCKCGLTGCFIADGGERMCGACYARSSTIKALDEGRQFVFNHGRIRAESTVSGRTAYVFRGRDGAIVEYPTAGAAADVIIELEDAVL